MLVYLLNQSNHQTNKVKTDKRQAAKPPNLAWPCPGRAATLSVAVADGLAPVPVGEPPAGVSLSSVLEMR